MLPLPTVVELVEQTAVAVAVAVVIQQVEVVERGEMAEMLALVAVQQEGGPLQPMAVMEPQDRLFSTAFHQNLYMRDFQAVKVVGEEEHIPQEEQGEAVVLEQLEFPRLKLEWVMVPAVLAMAGLQVHLVLAPPAVAAETAVEQQVFV